MRTKKYLIFNSLEIKPIKKILQTKNRKGNIFNILGMKKKKKNHANVRDENNILA